GGANFGMGSSRPVGSILRACGIAAVLATTINDLCLRNCINAGLPAASFTDAERIFDDGDLGTIDFAIGRVSNITKNCSADIPMLSPEMAAIVNANGLLPMLQREGLIETEPFIAANH